MDNVISTHIESVEDLFGNSEKQELSEAYSAAGIKEPEKSTAEKQKEMATEGLASLIDQEAAEDKEEKAEEKPVEEPKKEEKVAEEPKPEIANEEGPKDNDQAKLDQLSNMLDEENQASGAEPTEQRASISTAAEKPVKKGLESLMDQAQAEEKQEEASEPVQQQAEAQAAVPEQGDISATLDAYIAQQTAAGHDVDITKIDPEAIAQMMNG